jgi:UDP-N-acetylglucosamine 4,6-dehydratase
MEDLFQEANKWGDTQFHLARYGNVVCSNASVIPLFLSQRKAGGPITITDRNMTRFWIGLNEAIDLVLLSLQQEPGVIVVPKAPAMTMAGLARIFAGKFLNIKDIGIRPGEKVHEQMVSLPESRHTTWDEDHYFIYPPTVVRSFPAKEEFVYSSDHPRYWITWAELLPMITEAGFDATALSVESPALVA